VTALEDELRDSLARQAGHPSVVRSDAELLADRVIGRARRVRRRRRLGGAATALALAAMAGFGPGYLTPDHGQPGPVAAPSASTPTALTPATRLPSIASTKQDTPSRAHALSRQAVRLPVDLIANHQLITVDGQSVDVSFAGAVSQAYRVAEGWLVVGVPKAAHRASLWLLTTAGRRQVLLSGLDGVAVDAAGRRLAWRTGSRLAVGRFSGRAVDLLDDRAAADAGVPVGFVGDAVLMAGGRRGGYEVWWPDRGVYQSAPAGTAMAVYGGLSDGRTAVGRVSVDAEAVSGGAVVGGQRCLALFDASRRLALLKTLCGLGPVARSPGWVSPDGRWLLTGVTGRAVLVDLESAGGRPRVVGADPPAPGSVAWLDAQTVVLTAGEGSAVVRLRLDERTRKAAENDVERFPVPGMAADDPNAAPVLVTPLP
jgi:hypothetical protein